MNPARFRGALLRWYRQAKRDLPWRRDRDPYRVWVSEIMLQQTRVAAAIPYYEAFLARFPDVEALARAPEPELLAAWAGLGYYARARNLQGAARRIVERGAFPDTYGEIRELPGVGDYTAAAVASIAFGRRHAALDGNVVRVLTRVTAEPGDIGNSATRRRLDMLAHELLGTRNAGEFNQAMMELGATLCLPRQPQCLLCPVREDCSARAAGRQGEFPIRRSRAAVREVSKRLLILQSGDAILFWSRPKDSRRLAGFWELPEAAQIPGALIGPRAGGFTHMIVNTRYRLEVYCASIAPASSIGAAPEGFRFLGAREIAQYPLSTEARKALRCFDQRVRGETSTGRSPEDTQSAE